MKAFVLAAGEGTRMRPLTANIPKPLLPVAGKPFLLHALEALKANGIKEAMVLTGWQGARIEEYFGDGSNIGMKLEYEEQERRLGTAHAVSLARDHVDGDFLCLNGDVVVSPKAVKGMLQEWKRSKTVVVGLAKVKDPESFGVVVVEDGKVRGIEEKPKWPKTNLVNAGIYVFPPEVFDYIDRTTKSKRGEYEITDTLTMMMKDMEISAHELEGDWIDVGRPWDLLKANEILLKEHKGRIEGEVQERATIEGEVTVAEGATVKNGAYIVGPAIIDSGSVIGPNCFIRPSTYIGRGCKVGNACEVKNSILMDGAHVPHHNYVGDSILGERVNLGSGTKIANLRLDGRNVKAFLKGKEVDTGLRKLGAIIGDDVKTGINSVIDVGTIIGEGSFIGPGAKVRGAVAPHSKVL